MNWHDVLNNVIYPGILIIISALVGLAVKSFNLYITTKFKELNHFRGDSVVQEAILQAANELGHAVQDALEDGRLTDVEKKQLIEKVRLIADDKLKRLYGFYKEDLIGWIDERIDATLPKFVRSKAKAFVSKNL